MEKMNYAQSDETYELITIILKENFSKEVSEIGKDLLYNSTSTIPEIQSRLKLSFESVKNGLIILIQNRLIITYENFKPDTLLSGYELDMEGVLNILLYPKIILLFKNYYGEEGCLIAEEFINFGCLSCIQIFEQIKNKLENNGKKVNDVINKKVKASFLKLLEDNYLIQSKNIITEKKHYDFNIKRQKGKNKKTKEKINKNKNMDIDDTLLQEESKNDNININSNLNEYENPLLFNKETNTFYTYFFNYEQIIAKIKTDTIVNFINQKISTQAGLISSFLLEKNAITSFKNGKTEIKSFKEISKKFPSIQNIEKIVTSQNEYFVLYSSDSVYLDLNKIGDKIKSITIENYILQKYSNHHLRIFRLLSLCGALDSRNIMEKCLMLPKQSNSVLNQLFSDNLIEYQNIQVKGSNINFYFVDMKNCIMKVINICLKMILNIKKNYNESIEDLKLKYSDKVEQCSNKLFYSINKLFEIVLILKYL